MPYAYWRGECPSEKAPALGENACLSRVSDRTGIDREWMKKFEGGRSGTNWNCATEDERQRWRDEQTKQERVRSNIHNWGTNPVSFLRNNDLSLEFWGADCHFVREFFNFEPAINKNSQPLNRCWREIDRILSQSKTNDPNESATGPWYNVEWRFRGTRIRPHAYWGSECQSERAPA